MGLTGKAADQNVNWGETGGTNTSGAITPSESSTACSSPGGLLSPPCACGRIARALFLLRVCGVGQSAVDFSDIGIPPHIGPMLREHRATPWINFHLPPNLEPCPLKPEVKAPDAGEQRSDRQGLPHASLLGAKVAAGSPRRNPRGVITIGVMRVASPTDACRPGHTRRASMWGFHFHEDERHGPETKIRRIGRSRDHILPSV
jgi:hypothetical protein